jgi:hypothetical protein
VAKETTILRLTAMGLLTALEINPSEEQALLQEGAHSELEVDVQRRLNGYSSFTEGVFRDRRKTVSPDNLWVKWNC